MLLRTFCFALEYPVSDVGHLIVGLTVGHSNYMEK
jgi:hypothetical protein